MSISQLTVGKPDLPWLRAVADTLSLGIANDNQTDKLTYHGNPSKPSDPDLKLIERAGRGDQLACGMLVDRHLRQVVSFSQRLLGNRGDAEDVAQETFLRLWRHAGQWTDRGAKVTTWLHQVALNLCRDRLRRRVPEPLEAAAEVVSPEPGALAILQRRRVEALVRTAVEALPERQREAILLCHFQELGNIEAAATLGISVEALESLLSRARRSLRQRLVASRSDLVGDVGE
ncbi:RNA polymerase sigma-70 factor, ECF subfamily [Arboricoccus pini]|uniref:RNA polymerase sigma-70 factor, ECF subfamily n=1 Tax=Arboricoccus pini TaxID=1963835 RepID=A0A212PVR1_9PROT|nr:RNA polymerase sigma factor [Arboricoccus pini]SNB51063.1 RNA polymerase sigma-70 factor, ECF subfamily [Arboricoccus pini]